MKVLIDAGPTRESLDPVRFITNHSTGKMGYALAAAAVRAGHRVTLVCGPVTLPVPEGLEEFVPVVTAAQMAEAMKVRFPEADLTILCAAVADYRPKVYSSVKCKKSQGPLILELERTEDIALTLGGMKKSGQILVGFAAETDDLLKNAQGKLERKNLDYIAANIVGVPGRGFAADTNAITLIARDGSQTEFALQSKKDLAAALIDHIIQG